MINYEKVAEKIFSVIKGHDHDLVMFTEDGMETANAQEARRFFVSNPNYMVTLDGEARHIKINKNSNVELADMESIMKQLKNLATSNMLKTEIRVFGKEITPKDFAYQAKNLKEPAMENIQEASFSRMHGFKKTSYQTLESTKIVVRHRRPVEEEVQGSRARNIQAIFIEHAGERFRFPHNNLAGARAMARHINEGGDMHDPIGKYIVESINNYNKLMEFMRYARTNKLINENSEDIVKTVKESMGVIRREIGKLQGAKTYGEMKEHIASSDLNVIEEEGEDTSDLQDMFTVRKFDEKIGDVLPIVKKLMDNKQAWRDALVEASEKEVFISDSSELSETEVFEFDNPVQKMGYKVKDIADRMIGESDLQTFVGKVAGKLIEGEEISAFEKKVVGNVLGNAVIKEEEEICEGCGEIHEDCKCGPKDVVDLISDSFELKMKMLEHEDIFLDEAVPGAATVDKIVTSLKNRFIVKDFDEIDVDSIIQASSKWSVPVVADLLKKQLTNKGTRRNFANKLQSIIDDGHPKAATLQSFNDQFTGKKNMWADTLDEDSDDPSAMECPNCKEIAFVSKGVTGDIEEFECESCKHYGTFDAVKEDRTLADPYEPQSRRECGNCGDFSSVLQDRYGDDLHYVCDTCGFEENDQVVDLNFAGEVEDDGQPSEYEEWQDYMGGDDWDHGQYDEARMLELAGVKLKEGPSDSSPTDPEDFMDDCPDCGGTGKAQDSIFDDDECSTCNGEGYV